MVLDCAKATISPRPIQNKSVQTAHTTHHHIPFARTYLHMASGERLRFFAFRMN